MKTKMIRLFVSPQTWVRSGQKDGWLFGIPEEELIANYNPRHLKRKQRLEKYNLYKEALRKEAAQVGFKLPDDGAWVKFYYPMPKSWRPPQRARMSFEPHQSRPDASNLWKALEDALRKDDMKIWDYRVTKYWYDSPICRGYIEIHYPEVEVDMSAVEKMQFTEKMQDVKIK